MRERVETLGCLEIDFVCRSGRHVVPVECKAVLRLKGMHLRGLKDYLRQHAQPTGMIVSLAPFEVIKESQKPRIINVPLYLAEQLPELIERYG